MQNRQWYWGLALAAALAMTLPGVAQQTQSQQKQEQAKPNKNAATPFNPCTGSGLPATSQTMPLAPGSPGNINPPAPKSISGGVSCSNGKCGPSQKIKEEHERLSPKPSKPSLPLSPAGVKAEKQDQAKDENAFPLAKSQAAQKQATQVNAPAPSAAEANPFPQEKSEAAQATAQKAANQTPPQQGAYSSSDQRMQGMNALGNGQAVQGGFNTHQAYDPQLAKKDDRIGKFYLRSGDFAGAYGRYKEATEVNPGDLNAVIGLAMAADHLGRRAEAIQNYKLYLAVKPDGPQSKDALKALKRLSQEH